MSDRITLDGLRARGRHGVYDRARRGSGLRRRRGARARPGAAAARRRRGRHRRTTASWPTGWSRSITGEPVNLIETLADRLLDGLPRRRPGRRGDGHRAQAAGADPARVRRRRGHACAGEGGAADPGRALARQQPGRPAAPTCGPPSPRWSPYSCRCPGSTRRRRGATRTSPLPQRRGRGPWTTRRPRATGSSGPARSRAAAGRVRDPERRFGPRTLDVDVIAVFDAAGRPVRQRRPGADPAAPAGPPAGLRAPPVDRHRAVRPSCPVTAG